ncbi:MAG TPA: benzoyl-CoA reductase, bzd-type, subunit Q [Dehalococcoidia bacterium]|nr:benzoyl-CoA reductase, bzd-type, subunit Q [Dehalococcoidia bacterium]
MILKDGKILCWNIMLTGADSAESAEKVMDETLSKAGLLLGSIEYIVSTGYGRLLVPFANRNITEISCHAKGINSLFSLARTILDMGGQDCKAIRCDEGGKVTNFAMNDKCAAGAGRSMEVMARLLEVPLEDMGERSLQTVERPSTISTTCVVFAKSEVISLLHSGVHKNDIIAGLCDALSHRVLALLKRVGVEKEFAIAGGIAKNIGVVQRLEEKLGLRAHIAFEPQIVGALGAALFAKELLEKSIKCGVDN